MFKQCSVGLTRESQEAFQRINLHWHDLRHEYASRLVEQGVPLAQVRDLLGHASITTTERYDNQRLENLQAAAANLERGQVFDAATQADVRPPDWRKFQESFKSDRSRGGSDPVGGVPAIEANELEQLKLENWLGRRDSNPNNLLQRQVSYR